MEAKGKTMIKIVSILFIIGGALSTLSYSLLLALGGAGAASGVAGAQGKGTAIVLGMMLLYLIWSIILLIAGIMGVKNCEKPEAAKMLIAMGVILIVSSLIANVFQIITVGVTPSRIVTLFTSLVLPVLYIAGAKRNQG